MAIMKWTPQSYLSPFDEVRRDLNRLLNASSSLFDLEPLAAQPSNPFWAPKVDISESQDAVHITAELPGVRQEEIDIRMEGNTLVLKGKRQHQEELKDRNV